MPAPAPDTAFYKDTDNETLWRNISREFDYLYAKDQEHAQERFVTVLEDILVQLREGVSDRDARQPVGQITSETHGKSWPTYQRDVVVIDIVGAVDASENIEGLRTMLGSILGPYGLTPNFRRMTEEGMSPEDRAERWALDNAAIRAAR